MLVPTKNINVSIFFSKVNQHSSKMEISAVNTSLNTFGLHNITIAAYDVAGYSVLDIVEIPIFVKVVY